MEQRYYYKSKVDKCLWNVKIQFEDLTDKEEITEQEYNRLVEEYNKPREITPNPKYELRRQIDTLKQKLNDTDYKAIKYAEGLLTEEEYLPIKQQRQEWREQINELEREEK